MTQFDLMLKLSATRRPKNLQELRGDGEKGGKSNPLYDDALSTEDARHHEATAKL